MIFLQWKGTSLECLTNFEYTIFILKCTEQIPLSTLYIVRKAENTKILKLALSNLKIYLFTIGKSFGLGHLKIYARYWLWTNLQEEIVSKMLKTKTFFLPPEALKVKLCSRTLKLEFNFVTFLPHTIFMYYYTCTK